MKRVKPFVAVVVLSGRCVPIEMSVVHLEQTRRMKRRISKQVVYELLLNTYLLISRLLGAVKFVRLM